MCENTPLWQSMPSDENRNIDKLNNINYKDVIIYFDNGNIINVIPDVNNYYKVTTYNINGKNYNITNIDSVNSIPVPETKNTLYSDSIGTPVYRLEYLLRLHAGFEKDEGNIDLAYALMHKGTELLRFSNVEYQRKDYLREYYWLLDDDKIEEAQKLITDLGSYLPEEMYEKERIKEIQHLNYALLKRHYGSLIPKSFSAYMRIYNKQDAKFIKLKELVKKNPEELQTVLQSTSYTVYKHLKQICRENGFEYMGLHGLRHSFASLCYKLKISEAETMRLGGWSDPGVMRKIYTHLSNLENREAETKLIDFLRQKKLCKSISSGFYPAFVRQER